MLEVMLMIQETMLIAATKNKLFQTVNGRDYLPLTFSQTDSNEKNLSPKSL